MATRGRTEERLMNKSNRNLHKPTAHVPAPEIAPPKGPAPPAAIAAEPDSNIPQHRRCPLCWDRCRGVGVSYSTQGATRYYKCKRTLTEHPACAHTWSATVKNEVTTIRHQTAHLNSEQSNDK